MPERITFTRAAIAKLLADHKGERHVAHDAKQAGLIVDIRPTGAASFYLYKRIDGHPSRVRLGSVDDTTIEQARTACLKMIGQIAEGRNPAAERKAERIEHRFGAAFDWWLQNHAKVKMRSWKESQRLFDKHLAQWRNRRLSSIKGIDVQALHAELGTKNGPILANRVLALVRTIFNRALGIGYAGSNPTKNISKFPERNRERFLQQDEIARFFRALEKEPTTFQDFFIILLLTGARRGNVQAMRWDEINWQASTWTVSGAKMKNGQPLVVGLNPKSVETLLHRYNERDPESPFVFASHGKTGHLVEVKGAWKRIVTEAGLTDVRPHDLRHTLASWMAISGASLQVIGKALGHKSTQTTARYAHLTQAPVFEAVGQATSALLLAAEPAKPAKPAKKTTKRKAGGNGKKTK
jgi:integrase